MIGLFNQCSIRAADNDCVQGMLRVLTENQPNVLLRSDANKGVQCQKCI